MAQKNGPENLAKRMERLTEQSKQLRSNVTNNVFLINRSPSQIESVTRDMASKVSGQLNQTQIVKANSLLQKKGVDPEDMERKLVNLQVKTVEQLEFLEDTDIEGFMRQKHLQIMLSAIEETKTRTTERSDEGFLDSMESDWKEMMEVIVHSLGADLESVMKQGAELSNATTKFGGVMTDRSVSNRKQEEYARVLKVLNNCRRNQQPYGLITKLSEVCRPTSQSTTRTALQDSWQLLKTMIGEKVVARDGMMTDGPKEKAFEESDKARNAEFFIQGTLQFLHDQYNDLIQRELNFKSSSVAIGGDPNIVSTINGYLDLIYPNGFPSDLERGSGRRPIYAFLYFCLRIGDENTAIEVARKEEMSEIVKCLLWRYKDEGSPPSTLNITNLSTNTKDLYKHLLLNLLGRIDPYKGYNTIPRWSVQDWIWFQLNMISKKPQSNIRKEFTLQDLQRQVDKFGANHFNKDGKSPFLYFQVLLMAQQFEIAIDYGITNIISQSQDIIHIAVALYYYGIPNLHEKTYLLQLKPTPALNMVQLLTHYSKNLAQARLITQAVDYLVLIRNPAQQRRSIEQLAMDTRDYLFLFGEKEGGQGVLKLGKLYEYLPEHEVKEIIRNVSKTLEDENRTSDAILILDLIDEFSEVFRILIENLGKMLIPSVTYERDRRVLIDFTDSIFQNYSQSGAIQFVDPRKKATLHTLCNLISFFNLYNAEDYAEALKFIIKLDLLPYQSSDIDPLANAFKFLDSSIKNNFSQIAIVTMKSLVHLSLRGGNVSFDSPWTRTELKQFGNSIILFLGRLTVTGNYTLPGDIYTTLSQLDQKLAD
jgi:nuclear pore complex protein Nup93